MTRITHRIERRFVVPGRAVSFRSPHAGAYKRKIRQIAQRVFPSRPFKRNVDVFLDYFHSARRRVDVDNITKLVLDALNGVAYIDDRQVRKQSSEAYDLNSVLHLETGPIDLVKPLKIYREYLFVRVREVTAPPRRRRKATN